MANWKQIVFPILFLGLYLEAGAVNSIARIWNEELLNAIRRDYPAPTVHSRNLFHVSAAMYDAWLIFGTGSELPYLVDEKYVVENPEAARTEAISYAAFRILNARYTHSPGAETSLAAFHSRMLDLGFDPSIETIEGNSPAAIGNRIAKLYLEYFLSDGSNESNDYAPNTGYEPVNPPLLLNFSGTDILYPNFWQPLAFERQALP